MKRKPTPEQMRAVVDLLRKKDVGGKGIVLEVSNAGFKAERVAAKLCTVIMEACHLRTEEAEECELCRRASRQVANYVLAAVEKTRMYMSGLDDHENTIMDETLKRLIKNLVGGA